MRSSTIVLTVGAVVLTAAAVATGFFAGRGSVSVDPARVPSQQTLTTTTFPTLALPAVDKSVPSNPRADLTRALGQPGQEGAQAVRVAMNAWLAADGAAAIVAARDDPELGDVADRMMRLALYAYPEIFLDNPELLEGVPDQTIAMAVSGIAMFNPDAARELVETHLSSSMFGDAMLSMVEMGRQDFSPEPVQDPHAELEAILSEQGMMRRIPRLHMLVTRVAENDPVAAAQLIDDIPGSLRSHAVQALVDIWSQKDPEEVARWLEKKNSQLSAEGLNRLALRWGERDFEAADAFAATLTERRRAAFLNGLVNATHRLSRHELMAWVSRYETDPAYPSLIVNAAQRLVQEDVGAAIDLIETLPDEVRGDSYRLVLPSLAFEDPEAAVALLEDIEDESVREEISSMVSGIWAQNDAEAALDWALGLDRGVARDRALSSVSSSMMRFDVDRAVDAIDEIEDPEVRKSAVWPLLFTAETDDEAIRFGRDFGVDRDAVLEIRERRRGMRGPRFFEQYPTSFSVGLMMDGGADVE